MTDSLVLRTDQNHVATLTLNRPDKFNALSDALMSALEDMLAEVAADKSVRVVVLAANGKAYCAGHDLKEINEKNSRDEVETLFAKCSRLMLAINRLPQPVIAKVHGIATAAGCQLVATCDLAVVSDQARFATSGINVGLFCATPGVALSRNVPRKKAMEMLLSGDFIDAQTALHFGLVNTVVLPDELDGAIDDMAARIVRHSPQAISMGKSLFYRQLESGLDGAYEKAVDVIVSNMVDAQAHEGINAFVNKRPMPDWNERN
ncbi:MAG: enoyl-CoA hydratase [Rhodospirillales bacterium]|jgi:enoyl-CoA hydratase/carnithine racemase|nr:enoyl-CoA hydratase [Rhodospirillales bacterium]